MYKYKTDISMISIYIFVFITYAYILNTEVMLCLSLPPATIFNLSLYNHGVCYEHLRHL